MSHHATALRRVPDTLLLSLLTSQPIAERSGIEFKYSGTPDGLMVETSKGLRSASMRLDWAFGSGVQAITPVGQVDGKFVEHRISYYRQPDGPRRTLGHPGAASSDPRTALGIPQDPDTIFRCFNCHGTGIRSGPDLRSMIPGVTCERCHGPRLDHTATGRSGGNRKFGRDEVMQLCGSCHRLSQSAAGMPEADDPLSIRFAPVGLMASACFRKSNDLSCITCHDPHQDLSKNPASYDGKCSGCHDGSRVLPCRAGRSTGCISCHMQQRSPAEYLTFTDHRIRVYRTATRIR